MLAPDLVRTAARSEALADHGDRAGRPAGVAALVAGRAGLDAVGGDHAGPGVRPLAGPAAAPGRSGRPGPAHLRHRPTDRGHGERRHRRGGAGRPPAPPPGGLAAAGPGPVADGHGGGRAVPHLGAAGPSRLPAGGPVGGPVLPGHRVHRAHPDRLPAAADTHRVAALAPLALVGPGHGGRAGGPPAGGDGGRWAAGPVLPGDRRPLRPPRPRRGPAGRQPGRPGRHHPGRGRGRRLAGGTLPPCPRPGAAAAALGGPGRGPGGAGRPGRPGRPGHRGRGRHDPAHLGGRGVPGRPAGGHRGGDPALPAL
jgi:translation initiation factor IF-2